MTDHTASWAEVEAMDAAWRRRRPPQREIDRAIAALSATGVLRAPPWWWEGRHLILFSVKGSYHRTREIEASYGIVRTEKDGWTVMGWRLDCVFQLPDRRVLEAAMRRLEH